MKRGKHIVFSVFLGLAVLHSAGGLQESMLSFYVMQQDDAYYHADRDCSRIRHLKREDPLVMDFTEILLRYEACPECLGAAKMDAWSYPVSREILQDPLDVLRLVNKDHLLDKHYPDQEKEMYRLVRVTAPVTKGNPQMRAIADHAMTAMLDAAAAEGIRLYVGSAYRSYRPQEVMHYNRVKEMGYDDGYRQIAGASEHQTGLAADVVSWKYRDRFQQSFGETEEGIWLRENCAAYGFIIRYPEGKEDVTGVKYEPWHVRYVGKEAAAYIMDEELTLEEFTQEYQRLLSQ